MIAVLCAGCATSEQRPAPAPSQSPSQSAPAATSGAGKYYDNDGPGANPPSDLASVADAAPRAEPLHKFANQPYTVFGKTYTPAAVPAGTRITGRASWYGRKFHGSPTATGEIYDMYAMTAAHPTLPLPSYARVTNIQNKRSVVVRVNDRGPFLRERVIDLSYTAAFKLGFVEQGSAWVEVEPLSAPAVSVAALVRQAPQPNGGAPRPQASAEMGGSPAGHFVQLGAFKSAASAESFYRRVAARLDWIGDLLHVADRDGLLRVRAGPYRSAGEAGAAAQRIARMTGFSPVLTRF